MTKIRNKIFLSLILFTFLLSSYIIFKTTNYQKTTLISVNTTLDKKDFIQMIEKYDSYQAEKIDLYYQEYQLSHNHILALNKVNYPAFFEEAYHINSFKFSGGLFVNKNYYLEENDHPKNLVPVTLPKILRKDEAMLVDQETLKWAKLMFNDAKKKGLNLVVYSAYRSFYKQKTLFDNTTSAFVARPGHSEHQTGLALDIATKESGLTIFFEQTPEYLYLISNAHLYGFILRYPKNKEHLTLYPYEAWHFRYVGKELATYLYQNDLTLEEYIYLNFVL